MKKLIWCLSVLVIALFITACGNNANKGGNKTTVNTSAANKIYQQNCASCHGKNLEGQTGPALNKIGSKMSKADILKQIKNGGGGMPAGLISGNNADTVATWLASKK
ncbi:cytochrome c551 [Camelliibacillus cellulosilyticus]|uniref:Cytochrome c551 n=1 Tax=Camelliibacillus cellulosilyticus TaxID=2174486 RepID=A0ABV9GJ29_9BACL